MKYFINHDEITDLISFQIVFDVKMIDKNGFDTKYPLTKADNPMIIKWFQDKNDSKIKELDISGLEINGTISSSEKFLMRFIMNFADYRPACFSKIVNYLLYTEEDYFLRNDEYVTIKGYMK
jgi:hypothetical protein